MLGPHNGCLYAAHFNLFKKETTQGVFIFLNDLAKYLLQSTSSLSSLECIKKLYLTGLDFSCVSGEKNEKDREQP